MKLNLIEISLAQLKTMKILQIIYSLEPGGAEQLIVDLSNELVLKGHDVILCVLRDENIGNNSFHKKDLTSKVKYISLNIPPGLRLSNIYIAYKLINEIKPDVVHSHLNLINYIFPLTSLFPRIKFFHTIHSSAEKEVSNSLEYWLCRYYYGSGKVKTITISPIISLSFLQYYKCNSYREIYNGRKNLFPSDEYEEVRKYFEVLRKQYSTIFLHVARYSPSKNQQLLIRVFNKMYQEGQSIVLLIIGPEFDTPDGEELKSMASMQTIFLGEKHNVADYFLNADAFCLTSKYEGMPISLIEAFAAGCVPVCTPVGGMMDGIEHGVTGYLSKSLSEDDYYNALKLYLKNKSVISREKLMNYYKEKFSIELCANKYIECYNMQE